MVAEVMDALKPGPGRVLVDATVGDGGHAMAWLEAGGTVVGIDRDGAAIHRTSRRLSSWHDRVRLVHGCLSTLCDLAPGDPAPDGVLMDLGTSRTQIEDPERGFSYQSDGPLDMRMDRSAGVAVAALLRGVSVATLSGWLETLGDVPHARRVARSILHCGPPETSAELIAAVEHVAPPRLRIKYLSCVFQALRIVANDELNELRQGLLASIDLLRPGGRIAVLTYHSGEERAVRAIFRREQGQCVCPPGLPVCSCTPRTRIRAIEKGRRPATAEVAANPRARSARLWVSERTDVQ
ncbi:16S rRNA (cytosine(1402)-N(4))-methyltransferase RsmH [Candidatus Fermentibacteria bacterium]|nr:16S rRNA (cytosine(1402)-N(4))-methyltransferase RsmH [Candidatus Fermentibacteria bacterium]